MNDEYQKWINTYVAEHGGHVRGLCHYAVIDMTARFPELRQAAGFVHVSWGRDQHWWCVTTDGKDEIIDPTVGQFNGPVTYEELDLNDPATQAKVPSGKCYQCSGDAFMGRTFCSDECETEAVADLNNGRY